MTKQDYLRLSPDYINFDLPEVLNLIARHLLHLLRKNINRVLVGVFTEVVANEILVLFTLACQSFFTQLLVDRDVVA